MGMLAARRNDEDLFAQSTMTFGEHLEELRICLGKAVVGLVIGTLLGFFLGDHVVEFIERPLRGALKLYYTTTAERQYTTWAFGQYDAGKPIPYTVEEIKAIARPTETDRREFIYELEFVHPGVLEIASATSPSSTGSSKGAIDGVVNDEEAAQKRNRAVLGDPAARPRTDRANLVLLPLWHPIESDGRFNLHATGVTEPFTVWFKAALVVGALVSSPWVFFQIWTFLASGLYRHERSYVYTFLPFSLALFFLGAATAYLFVFEPVLNFLFGFNRSLGIDPDPKINEWLGFVLLLPLGFGISFQLPLVMLFLERIGVATAKDFIEKWRIAVLAIFVVSAVLTPADPYSVFFMAVPLTILYFGGILLATYLPRTSRVAA
jgi:sec-independent protein translocase protein TatC